MKIKIASTKHTDRIILGMLEITYFFNSNLLVPIPILFLKESITLLSTGLVMNVIKSQKIVVVKTTIGYFI